jgi:aryl-alcohol dehydrogenase-like predicted oxidoreductase
MAHPAITAAVMGTSSIEQLESNLPAFDIEMTPEQRQELTQIVVDAGA